MTGEADGLRELTPHERGLIDRLCADDWIGAEQARLQAEVAMYAGPDHGGGDNCFKIYVPDGTPLIPARNGVVYGLVVFEGEEAMGFLDLALTGGRLSAIEHSWFFEEPGPLPLVEQLRPNE